MKKIITAILGIGIIILALTGCQTHVSTDTEQNTFDEKYLSAKSIKLSDGDNQTITKGGYYTISGTVSNSKLIVDTTEKVYLQFAGVSIINTNGPTVQVDNADDLTITLKAGTNNTLTDGGTSNYNATIFSNDALIFEGDGNLRVTGKQAHGVKSDDNIIINGGNIIISAVKDGIHAKDTVTINGGNISIPSASEGIESKGNMIINNGSLTLLCSDDGINVATTLTINSGNIYAKSSNGDGIDANGDITINGGTIVAIGSHMPECGLDCNQNNLTITGGTLVATGGTNSKPTSETSTQCSVLLAGTKADNIFHLESVSGEILTFKADTAYDSMVFSSPLLKTGQTYTIYTGGAISGGTELNGIYSDATYTKGTQCGSFNTKAIVTVQGGNTESGGNGKAPTATTPNGNPPKGNPPEPPDDRVPDGEIPVEPK